MPFRLRTKYCVGKEPPFPILFKTGNNVCLIAGAPQPAIFLCRKITDPRY